MTEIRRRDTGEPGPVYVMVLQERAGPRRLPIWIGRAEAIALAVSLEALETPRRGTAADSRGPGSPPLTG